MERSKPFGFQRPGDLAGEFRHPRRLLQAAFAGEHEVKAVVPERNPVRVAGFHQRLPRLLRDPNSVRHADLPQSENIPPGRRLHAERFRLRREVPGGDEVLKHGGVEPDAVDPVLASVSLRRRVADGRARGEGACPGCGEGAGDVERLRRGEEAEVAEVAGLAGDDDDVSEANEDDENAEEK